MEDNNLKFSAISPQNDLIWNHFFSFLGGANGSNGFTAVGLHATGGSQINNGQPLPIQSIKPIQAVQPQIHNTGKTFTEN